MKRRATSTQKDHISTHRVAKDTWRAVAQRRRFRLIGAVLAILLSLALASLAAADGPTHSFNMTGPNVAENPSTHDTIRLTGSGTFDVEDETVAADGSFKHFDENRAVVARGTWTATGFTSFTSFGGPHPGFQGGELHLIVTLFPVGGAPVTGVPMTFICLVGVHPPGVHEGTALGDFTHMVSGLNLIHLVD